MGAFVRAPSKNLSSASALNRMDFAGRPADWPKG